MVRGGVGVGVSTSIRDKVRVSVKVRISVRFRARVRAGGDSRLTWSYGTVSVVCSLRWQWVSLPTPSIYIRSSFV